MTQQERFESPLALSVNLVGQAVLYYEPLSGWWPCSTVNSGLMRPQPLPCRQSPLWLIRTSASLEDCRCQAPSRNGRLKPVEGS